MIRPFVTSQFDRESNHRVFIWVYTRLVSSHIPNGKSFGKEFYTNVIFDEKMKAPKITLLLE
jgi:hypothetical protein